MTRRFLTMTMMLFSLVCMTSVQAANLKMRFNFENVSGTEVSDPISGVTAKLVNDVKVFKIGSRNVLKLGKGTGYLDMTSAAGSVVHSLGDYTVSVYCRVDADAPLSGNGFFLWSFSQSAANTQYSAPYMAYRLNAQRFATSTGGWSGETGIQVGSACITDKWVHVLYRQSGQNGELFIDGVSIGTVTNMPKISTAFTAVPAYNWIGRAPFSGDSYLTQTLVSDFCIYDAALTDDEVKELADVVAELEDEYYNSGPGDFTSLQAIVIECKTWLASATGYAPNAISELQDAVTIAEMAITTGKASQITINEYEETLQSLLTAAKATSGYVAKKTFEPTGNYGFIHPGGIVSQEDIDRAKKLLADGDTRIKAAWDILCANEYSSSTVATYPVESINRGGSGTQNYMNAARGAAMAYQNALRWKIGGTKANADAAVRILMAWCNGCKSVNGDSNQSLAAGIYGYEFANAAELMRDYEGWSEEDFKKFQQWMIKVWYNKNIDFLRRRHDTWLNSRHSGFGERPGHYWSNWGLCNALCVMSIGILCDDVHMYNQGVSFYKYDHVGTFKDRSSNTVILNDGCNEFIGNLVPVVLPDDRGPFGYLGQMQESGRDQGHSLMALGLALDICQVALNQGDDLYAYMDDRIAAGAEFVAAMNFGGVESTDLPWITYNYSDCGTRVGQGWAQTSPNTGGMGEYRPYWDRLIGYYEGLRGVKMQYSEKASATVCPDGGGGNYSQNSGGFDHVGFSTLTSWRPAITSEDAMTPLYGDIVYKGVTYKNQTNLGGLKYKYDICASKGIPADGSEITLIPQLPEDVTDSGNWQWETGETTRQITVKADKSHIYRVTYTATNGVQSRQAFAIAVCGDAEPDVMTNEITVDEKVEAVTEKTVLAGSKVILYSEAATGWTNDYLWDNGTKSNTVTIPGIMQSRTYTCQYANQAGAVSEELFKINVVPARQLINGAEAKETMVLKGTSVILTLEIASAANPNDVTWSDGTKGITCFVEDVNEDLTITATYLDEAYTYNIKVKQGADYSYYSLLTADKGYRLVTSSDELALLASDHYFVIASDQADLLVNQKDAPLNGNKALFVQTPEDPLNDLSEVFTIETYNNGFSLRNIDYDGFLLQTEMDKPNLLRTHDQPFVCEWTILLMQYADAAWTIENGKYTGNWLGLWTPANGYRDGEELACNKTGSNIAKFQIFAIEREKFHTLFLDGATEGNPKDATAFIEGPDFTGKNYGWTMTGSGGNLNYNGAVEIWHRTGFNMSQTIPNLPDGKYTVTCQMVNGENSNTGYLYATSGTITNQDVVSQSCAGSSFTVQRNKMTTDANYGLLSVDIDVVDGILTLGIKEPSSNTWLVWDNFTLTYKGNGSVGVEEIYAEQPRKIYNDVIYDLQGRPCKNPVKSGIYILNGKKFIVR